MPHTTRLAVVLCTCLASLAAQGASWNTFTTQDLVPAAGTFLAVDACNTAAGDPSACARYDEIDVGTSIDRSLLSGADWRTRGAADLSLGTVGIAGGGPYPYDRALTSAGFSELLSFDFPGLPPGTSAEVGFSLALDGSLVDGSKVGMVFAAGNAFDSDPYYLYGSAEWRGSFMGSFYDEVAATRYTLAAAPDFRNGTVYDARWTTTGQTLFVGHVDVRVDAPTLPLQWMLYGNGAFDLASTGRLSLLLPAGASVASESGVFLSAVPEPSAGLQLLLGGLALAGLARRRRLGAGQGSRRTQA